VASKTEPENVLTQLLNIYWLHQRIKVFNYRHRHYAALGNVQIGNGQLGNGHSVIYVRNYAAYSLTLVLHLHFTSLQSLDLSSNNHCLVAVWIILLVLLNQLQKILFLILLVRKNSIKRLNQRNAAFGSVVDHFKLL
jgi:hypothetical protein